MATSYDEIEGFLKEKNLKFRRTEKYIQIGFKSDSYRDRDGDDHIPIIIKLEEDGEYLKVFTPFAFSLKDTPHKCFGSASIGKSGLRSYGVGGLVLSFDFAL